MEEVERRNPQQLARVYEALNVLGEQAYRINSPMLAVVDAAVEENQGLAGLPVAMAQLVLEKPNRAPRFRTQAHKGQVRAWAVPAVYASLTIRCRGFRLTHWDLGHILGRDQA